MHDKHGFKHVELSRNNNRVVQSSLDMLQSWRGNCDFQLMLYDSDPFNPDPAEIARVTDYIVAYASKGNVSLVDEKKQIRRLITRCAYANKGTSANCCIFAVYSHPSFFYCSMSDDTGSQLDVIRLSRHLLNRAASNRTISKQECMVLLSGLDLVMCSESIEMVSITGSYRLQDGASSTFYSHYEK